MNRETAQPLHPTELRKQVMAFEEGLRRLVKHLGLNGQYETRSALLDAADLLLDVGRSLPAEPPPGTSPELTSATYHTVGVGLRTAH
ncbi:hypothetical protein ACIF8T_31690 [Streptomyces sp. NPDC085946]|uniref:hypothetical protein n=1 Tax=Streptomyces sp. NPDC085946 TaxID=3365744 RepID=UPI0037D4AC1E